MPKVDIVECWREIEEWLRVNAPDALTSLPKGVSSRAIAKAEKTLGFEIPKELKTFLFVHDGSAQLWLHELGAFMSVANIVTAWDIEFDVWGDGNNDEWAEPKGPIKKKWFTRKWLPILDMWTGDHICIDLEPARGGRQGQLIGWYHTQGPTEVVAVSFSALLEQFVAELYEGRYAPKLNRQGGIYLAYD